MSEKPMSSDIMMMMFGRDCAATVARPASPPCATPSDNNKTANVILITMLFIFVKPPAANVGQEKWRARVLAGRDFAFHAFRKTRDWASRTRREGCNVLRQSGVAHFGQSRRTAGLANN